MNDHQKDRLIKIAETNPELAREMMEFLKEAPSSQEPIAVKMVKSEDDKIEITAEQRKKFVVSVLLYGLSIIFVLLGVTSFLCGIINNGMPDVKMFLSCLLLGVITGVSANVYCSLQIGLPVFKKLASKHFRW